MMSVNSKVEKVDHQNCVKPTEKVQQPKFHKGDWVVLTIEGLTKWFATYQIVNVDTNKNRYQFNDDSYLLFEYEDHMRPWTIEDPKEGRWECA